MAELLSTGLVIDRYPEIKQILIDNIQERASGAFSFEEGEVLTHIIDILATEMAKYEEVLQLLYSSLDRDKATDERLDALLYLVGLERLSASKSAGSVLVTAGEGATIPSGSVLENPSSGARFLTTLAVLSTVLSCREAHYEVSDVLNNTVYTISVNGTSYTHLSSGAATAESIVAGLISSISADPVATYSASISYEPTRLVVTSNNGEDISVESLQYLTPHSAQVLVPVEASEVGAIRGPAYAVSKAVTPIPSLISLYNPEDFGIGRLRETDAEFVLRAQRSLAVSGSSTYSAMLAAILNLDFVSTVLIEENETADTNALGLPPHSFEVIVSAPDTQEINETLATVIFEEKPLGIQTHGNTSVSILDSTGSMRNVKFSRPSEVVIAIRVTYSLYSEEVPPEALDLAIRGAVVAYGETLISGKDVIPQRFIGGIYNNTEGVGAVTVEAQVLAATGDTPVPANWSTDKISILPSEYASFQDQDIYLVEV